MWSLGCHRFLFFTLPSPVLFFSVHSSKGSVSRKNQVQSSGGLASNLFSVQSCGGLGLKQIEGAIVWMPCFERTAVCNRLEALS